MLIDFQWMRIGAPALDITYLSYLCHPSSKRPELLPGMLETYYNQLESNLQRLGNPIPYSKENLKADVSSDRYGIFCGMFTLPLHTQFSRLPLDTEDVTTNKGESDGSKEIASKLPEMSPKKPGSQMYQQVSAEDNGSTQDIFKEETEITSIVRELVNDMVTLGIAKDFSDIESNIWRP